MLTIKNQPDIAVLNTFQPCSGYGQQILKANLYRKHTVFARKQQKYLELLIRGSIVAIVNNYRIKKETATKMFW